MTLHPRHPHQLPGSKWTSHVDDHPYRHWEVLQVRAKAGTVRLRATLSADHELELPWRDLRNRDHWTPGWVST